jgi:succinoglycan biosynthesis transport protein ExoP
MEDEGASFQQTPTAFATRFFNQLHEYKRLLLKFWWIPILTVGIADGIQVLLLKHTAPMFESVGKMIVSVKLSIPNANVYSEELNNFFGTQVALMQSDSVKYNVSTFLQTNNPDLHALPVSIDVSLVPKTSIFSLEAQGSDPWYTQAYLAATMEQYIQLKKELLATASSATQSSMEEELAALAIQLTNSKAALEEYQSNNSVVFLQPTGENSAASRLATLTQRLADAESELALSKSLTLDQNLERMQGLQQDQGTRTNNAPGQSPDATESNPQANTPNTQTDAFGSMPATLGEFEQDYLKAKQQIILLTQKQKEYSRLSKDSQQMIDLNDEIARQQSLLETYKDQSEEQLRNRQHTMQVQIDELGNQVKEWQAKALEVSRKLSDYDTLRENHQRLQALYDSMEANLQTLDLNKGMGQESVTILEPACVPVPVPPQTRKHLIMSSLIGLVLGIGILVLINQLDDRIRTFAELEQQFDLPVLGQIPLVKPTSRKAGVKVLQADDNRYPLIEAYRSLRSALLYKDLLKSEPVQPPKRIVITSACPNDGKSMTATNLAITFAQAGARVLLVDTDMRRGKLHSHFSAAISPGMAEVLTGQCAWSAALIQTTIPNLDLLPCGTPPRHSQHVFAAADKFLKDIEGHYDYYIFDSAPVMAADDVLSLAPNVDGLIMVVRAGFTPGRIAHAALNLLNLRKVNVLGIVFNAVHPKTSDFYYYRFKEYYSQPQAT